MLIGGACADWPRSQNLPANEGSTPSNGALGDLIRVDWTVAQETNLGDVDYNDTITSSIEAYGTGEISRGNGITVYGSLQSTGWNKEMARPSLTLGESCATTTLDDVNIDEGFYIGDLDFYTLKATSETDGETVALCATVQSEEERLGWDLLLIELDGCDVAPLIRTDEEAGVPLGYGLGGSTGTWSAPIELGKTYAVMHAGYTLPTSDTAEEATPIAYQLGVSVVRQSSESSVTICPNLPESQGEES